MTSLLRSVPVNSHAEMTPNGWSLRELCRTLETPGANRLRLNLELVDQEAKGQLIAPPGSPIASPYPQWMVSDDCVTSPFSEGAIR
jgi:hypothetical protein